MAEILASVLARSAEQIVRAGRQAAMLGADWLEVRLDEWPPSQDLAAPFAAIQLPILVACRTPEDGGSYRGTLAARRELLTRALQAGAEGIDLEQWEKWNPSAGRTRLRLRIRSFHSFTGVPKELRQLRDELSSPGTVVKLVVTAHDLADAAPVLELLRSTDQVAQPTVAFAMGRTAWPTRVLAAALGAPFVYGSLDPARATVPDQPPISLLKGLYRVGQLGDATQIFGLLGNPALHSLGPWLHNRAFRRLGVDAVYLPLETSKPEAVMAMLPTDRLAGLSVTAPFKERLQEHCMHTSDEADAVGVVNTLLASDAGRSRGQARSRSRGYFTGHNTDVLGVRAALENAGAKTPEGTAAVSGNGHKAVVLGAGGAARAGAYALLQLGYEVTMLGRSLDGARAFAEANGIALGSLSTAVLDSIAPRVVVHATPVGSEGRDPEERLLPDWRPAAGTIVHDMVYRPIATRLLRDAEAAGAIVVPGVEMFLAQARAQVRLFAGKDVSAHELRGFLAGAAMSDGPARMGAEASQPGPSIDRDENL
ncbi:MAG: type I 3-dehydroquinate dehydratase [Planctomycetota bacterium]